MSAVLDVWCDVALGWIGDEQTWDLVPECLVDKLRIYSVVDSINVEIQGKVNSVLLRITEELQKPRFLCNICGIFISSKYNKLRHESKIHSLQSTNTASEKVFDSTNYQLFNRLLMHHYHF